MEAPHAIDRSRLLTLENRKDLEFAAARKSNETASGLRRECTAINREIERIKSLEARTLGGAGEKTRQIENLLARRAPLVDQIRELDAEGAAASERAQAASALFDSCNRFLGNEA